MIPEKESAYRAARSLQRAAHFVIIEEKAKENDYVRTERKRSRAGPARGAAGRAGAQLEKEQAEFAAAKERGEEGKKSFLNNNDPNFVNPKEKLYDKFPLTVHQMDIIIGVLFALIILFLVLGMTHTSFFGLFGG